MSYEPEYEDKLPPRSFFGRLVNIILQPTYEWQAVIGESRDKSSILMEYTLPLAFVVAVAAVLCEVKFVLDWKLGFGDYVIGFLLVFLMSTALFIAVTYAIWFLLMKLSPNFGGDSNDQGAFMLAAYGATPLAIVLPVSNAFVVLTFQRSSMFDAYIGIVSILSFALIIYAAFITSKGAKAILAIPTERATSFLVTLCICFWLSFNVLTFVYEKADEALQDKQIIPSRERVAAEQDASIREMEEMRRDLERTLRRW